MAAKAYEYLILKGSDNYYYLYARQELLNVRFLRLTGAPDSTMKEELVSWKRIIKTLDDSGPEHRNRQPDEGPGLTLQGFYT